MKKVNLYFKSDNGDEFVKQFDTVEEASEYVKEDADEGNVFDYFTKEVEVEDEESITAKVNSYADACKVLGIEPMDEAKMKAAGFRQDEIARRQLETIVEALNEGWKPDYNDMSQDKWRPWFWVESRPYGATAGLAYALTHSTPSNTNTNIGSRLCFKTSALARYAANTFTRLYEEILVTNY